MLNKEYYVYIIYLVLKNLMFNFCLINKLLQNLIWGKIFGKD